MGSCSQARGPGLGAGGGVRNRQERSYIVEKLKLPPPMQNSCHPPPETPLTFFFLISEGVYSLTM